MHDHNRGEIDGYPDRPQKSARATTIILFISYLSNPNRPAIANYHSCNGIKEGIASVLSFLF
jgi:hypothetical protein